MTDEQVKEVLVVAVSSVGGPALGQAVLDRHRRGAARFHVLVPERVPNQGNTVAPKQLESEASARRDLIVDLIAEMGVDVDGEVTRFSDVADAIDVALHDRDVDEVIVVQGAKGLKKMGDKHRVKKLDKQIDIPITQIDPGEADEHEDDSEQTRKVFQEWAAAVERSPDTP